MIYEFIQAHIGVSWLAFTLAAVATVMVVVGGVAVLRRAWRGWTEDEVPPEAGGPMAPLPTATAMPRSRFPAIRRQALPAIERHNDFGAVSHVDPPDERAPRFWSHAGEGWERPWSDDDDKKSERTFSCLPGGGRRGTDKSGMIGQTPATRSPSGDVFSLPIGDVGRKAPAADPPKPPKIEGPFSLLPGGGRRRRS